MELKANIMKKIILLCSLLVLGCFGDEIENLEAKISQEKTQKTQDASQTGWFFGVGLGGGMETLETIRFNKSLTQKDNFALFMASTQIGGYHYFNPWAEIRYYYSLDLSFNPGKNKYSSPQYKIVSQGLEGYFVFYHHMLNLDFVFNLYSSQTLDFGVILGVGGGVSKMRYTQKAYGFHLTKLVSFGNSIWDIQTTAGMRLLFDRKYGIELKTKMMPLKKLIVETDHYGGRLFRQSSYNLTLNFVMEL